MENKPTIRMILDSAIYVVTNYISKTPGTIISIEENNDTWKIVIEVIERKVIPDTMDILGRYEINLDKKGELLGWKQQMIRRRSDLIIQLDET